MLSSVPRLVPKLLLNISMEGMARKRHGFGEDYDSDDEPNLFYRQASSRVMMKSIADIPVTNEIGNEFAEPAPTEPFHCLSYLQGVLFACVLEDGITQLRILDECNNELRIIKTMADMATLRARKYQIKQRRNSIGEVANVNPKDLGAMQYKLDKLAADRMYCAEVMLGTYLELSLDRHFSSLINSNKDIESRDLNRLILAEEEAHKKNCRRELMKQLRQQRNHIKSVAYDTDLIVDRLRSQVEDAALHAETRGRYITNWQRARTEQHTQSIQDKEAGPSDAINYYRIRADQEHRIHAEVELLVNIFINETLAKVENWMTKYDIDMEAIDLKIQIMKNKYQDQIDKRVQMEETYAEHELLMKNWVQFKDDRQKARMYKDKMTKSAIIVQAWWRGLLVRLELGPYKPKRRPPAKKK